MKKKNQWLFPVLLVLIIAVTSALPVLLGKSGKETEKETSIRTAKAERKDITATLSGTGTLVSQDPLDVEIPSGVEVTEYLVSNGDTVKKGQLLARVDPVAVQEAISACQETIDYLEDRMYALEYHQSTRYIMVPETGTVKAIYCKPGDKVADVMLEYGCLGIIDINGEEWKAQAFNGTVKFINATEGSTVYHSHTFIMLDDLAETSEYDTLLAQHQKYESIMEQLAAMYREEAIFSPGDGIVDGIAEEEDEADQDAETKELLDKLTELEEQGKKNDRRKPDFPNMTENGEFPQMPEGFSPDSMPEGFSMGSAPQIPGNTTAQQPVPAENAAALTEGKKILHVTSAVYEGRKNTVILAEPAANGDYVEGRIENDMVVINNKTYFVENDIVDMGKFVPQNGKTYLFIESCTESVEPLEEMSEEEPKDLKYTALYEMPSSGAETGSGEMPGMGGGEMITGAGMKNGGMSAGFSTSSESEEETFEMYPAEETVIMSVIPEETLSIEITVDELDLLDVHTGQEAVVTIDAVPGKSYEGTVTAVNSAATVNAGGQTKFSATVTIEKKDDLLAGMNASTLIVIGTKENVLAVPVKALSEENGKTYVYTGYDEKKGELLNRTEVTTGASDGENAEILSGLSENDTVMYEYSDTVDIDTMSAGKSSGLFDGFRGLTGGGRPSAGSVGRRF